MTVKRSGEICSLMGILFTIPAQTLTENRFCKCVIACRFSMGKNAYLDSLRFPMNTVWSKVKMIVVDDKLDVKRVQLIFVAYFDLSCNFPSRYVLLVGSSSIRLISSSFCKFSRGGGVLAWLPRCSRKSYRFFWLYALDWKFME